MRERQFTQCSPYRELIYPSKRPRYDQMYRIMVHKCQHVIPSASWKHPSAWTWHAAVFLFLAMACTSHHTRVSALLLRRHVTRSLPIFGKVYSPILHLSPDCVPNWKRRRRRIPIVLLHSMHHSFSEQSAIDTEFPAAPRMQNITHYSEIQSSSSTEGLSKFHLSILRHSVLQRQRFVTGRDPIFISLPRNPTRQWLNLGVRGRRTHTMAETQVFINGTIAARSLASLDRFYWLDDKERNMQQEQYGMISMELLAEIHMDRPGYVQILPAEGAGSGAADSHRFREQLRTTGWTLQAMNLFKNQRHEEQNVSPTSLSSMSSHGPNTDRLWVTGFSLTGRQGLVTAVDCAQCYIQPLNERSKKAMLWPNEVQSVPANLLDRSAVDSSSSPSRTSSGVYQDALLVCDGFLVPTKDRGGLYIVKNPGHETEWTVALTAPRDRWFYHRAVWMDLTGDGRQSILTARCQVSTVLDPRNSGNEGVVVTSGIQKAGQLVWLECPQPSRIDAMTGTPLEQDGTVFDPFHTRHLPWKARVLATGPDVMFSVADMDGSDDTIEVLASEFFTKQVTLLSIRRGMHPRVVFQRKIDDQSGRAFGSILADLDIDGGVTGRCVMNSGSTVNCLNACDSFSHLLVTSHECSYAVENSIQDVGEPDEKAASFVHKKTRADEFASVQSTEGGSLFAYRVPEGKDAWKTDPWKRTTVASGFKVNGKLNNMINPGAPGFVYTFYANRRDAQLRSKRPMIAIAGDCAESAYILRPDGDDSVREDPNTNYKVMAEIQCEATVGSIGIGYDDFSSVEQERGFAKLYIPCFEKDKILVFGLGSGEDDSGSGW